MRRSTLALALLGCLCAFPATADDGFQLSDLNPFKGKANETEPVTAEISDELFDGEAIPQPPAAEEEEDGNGFSLPSLPAPKLPKLSLPTFSRPARPTQTPSAWSRLNQGTKAFFARTKSALTPWDQDADDNPPRRYPGQRVASRPQRTEKKTTLMSHLFGGESTENEIETVNDYLALPRPDPYE